MKNCSSCSKELADNAKFCPGCGSKQEALVSTAAETQIAKESVKTSLAHEELHTPVLSPTEEVSISQQGQATSSKLPYLVIGIIVLAAIIWFILGRNNPSPQADGNKPLVSKPLNEPAPIQAAKIEAPKIEAPKIEAPVQRETLEANATALNQQITQIIAARQAWFNGKSYSFASKAPITTGAITNVQMSDATYPTPLEAKEMKEWIDYRQGSYRKIDALIPQYEPLSNLMKESLALNKEMANKYAASTYDLVNGKLTYGEFNTIRKNDGTWYENARQTLAAKYNGR